jgi:hypothetical protein
MTHVIEIATSGRSRCRGCERKIAKSDLRFGEREPNPFGDGETTLWFHLRCAAFKRPQQFLEALENTPSAESAELRTIAEQGIRHRRLVRVDGAERAPTSRASCRSCREPIERGSWRIPLVFFEAYRFERSGFVHAGCAAAYFETADILDRVHWFTPDLDAAELAELAQALALQRSMGSET